MAEPVSAAPPAHVHPTLLYFPLIAMLRAVVQGILFGGHLRVAGRENVPRHGGLLVIGNHIAGADPPVLAASLPRPLHFMAKAEWFSRPWLGMLGRTMLCFPVVRHTADRAALRFTLTLLAAGEAVCVYPEGTRSRDLQLHAPEAGAGFLARRAGVPILPVATWGGENVLPTGARFPNRTGTEVHLVFGKPFTLADSMLDNQEAAEFMMSKVAEMLPVEYRGYYRDWQPGASGRHRRLRPGAEARTA